MCHYPTPLAGERSTHASVVIYLPRLTTDPRDDVQKPLGVKVILDSKQFRAPAPGVAASMTGCTSFVMRS
ncbi:hypothetical protein HYQ46_006517 [Verticillium longisporum]|nr:hypothetical protein HYQ46_006517 [Verticillium longisporum]